jgi:hypothetical protein
VSSNFVTLEKKIVIYSLPLEFDGCFALFIYMPDEEEASVVVEFQHQNKKEMQIEAFMNESFTSK